MKKTKPRARKLTADAPPTITWGEPPKNAALLPERFVLYPELEKGSGHVRMHDGTVEFKLPNGQTASLPFNIVR